MEQPAATAWRLDRLPARARTVLDWSATCPVAQALRRPGAEDGGGSAGQRLPRAAI